MVDSGGLLSRCTGFHPVPRVRIPPSPPIGSLLLALLATGCVERFVRIDSDPAGAEIHVNGRHVGRAPIDVPFVHYGTVRVDAWTAERPGVTQYVELAPPWYERFPFELVAELLDPFDHVDRHEVTIVFPEAATPATREEVLRRAEELRAETR